jgi:hypothetical protein
MPQATSLWNSQACALFDTIGKVVKETKVATRPEALVKLSMAMAFR